MKRLALLAAAAVLCGCADSPVQPAAAPAAPRAVITDPCVRDLDGTGEGCTVPEDTTTQGESFWHFFGPWGDTPYQAEGDPFPSQPGIYLGWVKPEACFSDLNREAIAYDADLDWLDDRCELELARAFAPSMKFAADDACPDGEPYWGAKYFPSKGVVRIAYLPAYYKDCGTLGHAGDSEFIAVEVVYVPSMQHWLFHRMYLSAHHGAPTDRSAWYWPAESEFTWRFRAYPAVWVAKGKHANYNTESHCDTFYEECSWYSALALRFPVDPNRNVGSRFVQFKDRVYSEKLGAGVDPARWEYLWAETMNWRGWQHDIYGDPPEPYSDWLRKEHFEVYWDGGVTLPDYGPGPAAPPRSPSGPTY